MAWLLQKGLQVASAIVPEGVKAAIVPAGLRGQLHEKAWSGDLSYENRIVKQRIESEKMQREVATDFDIVTKGITDETLFPPDESTNPLRGDMEYRRDINLINGYLKVSENIKTIQQAKDVFATNYVLYKTNIQIAMGASNTPYFQSLNQRLDPIDRFTITAVNNQTNSSPMYEVSLSKRSKHGHVYRQTYKNYDFLLFFFSLPLHIALTDDLRFQPEYQEYLNLKQQMRDQNIKDVLVYNQRLLDQYVTQQEQLLNAQIERDRQQQLREEEARRKREEERRLAYEREEQARYNALSPDAKTFVNLARKVQREIPKLTGEHGERISNFLRMYQTSFLGNYFLEGASVEFMRPRGTYVSFQYPHRFVIFLTSVLYKYPDEEVINPMTRRPYSLDDRIVGILQTLTNLDATAFQTAMDFSSFSRISDAAQRYLYPNEIQRNYDLAVLKERQQQQQRQQQRPMARRYGYGGRGIQTQKQKQKKPSRTKTHKH
jgi:hypothetical protein